MSGAGRKLTIRMPDNRRLRDARIAQLHVDPGGWVSSGTPVLSLAVHNREHMVRSPRAGRVVPLVSPGDIVAAGDTLYTVHIDEVALAEANLEGHAAPPAEQPRRREGTTPAAIAQVAPRRSRRATTALDTLAAGWGKPILAIALYLLACFALLPLLRAFGHDAQWPVQLAMVAGSVAFGLLIAYLYAPASGFLAKWVVRMVAASWMGVSVFTIFGPLDMRRDVPVANLGDPVTEPPTTEVVVLDAESSGELTTTDTEPKSAAETGDTAPSGEARIADAGPTDAGRIETPEATAEAVFEPSGPGPLVDVSEPVSPVNIARQAAVSGFITGRPLAAPMPVHEPPSSVLEPSPDSPAAHAIIVREWARHRPDERTRVVLAAPVSSAAPAMVDRLADISRRDELRPLPGPVHPVPQAIAADALARDRAEDWTPVLLVDELVEPRTPGLPHLPENTDSRPHVAELVEAPAPLQASPDVTRAVVGSVPPEMVEAPELRGTIPVPEIAETSEVAGVSETDDVTRTREAAVVDAVAPAPSTIPEPARPQVAARAPVARLDPAPKLQPTVSRRVESAASTEEAHKEIRAETGRRWKGTSSGGMLRGSVPAESSPREDNRFIKAPPPASELTATQAQLGLDPDPVALQVQQPVSQAWMQAQARQVGAQQPLPARTAAETPVEVARQAADLVRIAAADGVSPAMEVVTGPALAILSMPREQRVTVEAGTLSDGQPDGFDLDRQAHSVTRPATPAAFPPVSPAEQIPSLTVPEPAHDERVLLFLYYDDLKAESQPGLGDNWAPDLPEAFMGAIRSAKVEAIREVVRVSEWCTDSDQPAWLNDRLRLLQVRLAVEPSATAALETALPVFDGVPQEVVYNRRPLLGGGRNAPVMAEGWAYLQANTGPEPIYFDAPDALAAALAAKGCSRTAWEADGPTTEIGAALSAKLSK